jgi:hypothetical protein
MELVVPIKVEDKKLVLPLDVELEFEKRNLYNSPWMVPGSLPPTD